MKYYKFKKPVCIGTLLGADVACLLFLPKELPMHTT